MTPAELWLREHCSGAPERLLACMVGALPATTASVPDALLQGAVRLYREVTASDCTRDDALPLLAADALLTHAFQVQAEFDVAGVEELADRCSGAELLGGIAQQVHDQ